MPYLPKQYSTWVRYSWHRDIGFLFNSANNWIGIGTGCGDIFRWSLTIWSHSFVCGKPGDLRVWKANIYLQWHSQQISQGGDNTPLKPSLPTFFYRRQNGIFLERLCFLTDTRFSRMNQICLRACFCYYKIQWNSSFVRIHRQTWYSEFLLALFFGIEQNIVFDKIIHLNISIVIIWKIFFL